MSKWRLFRGSSQLTAGYYYFAGPNAPFLPYPHNLGSRDWVSDDFQDPPLGEYSGPRSYRKGDVPVPAPPASVIGTLDCLSNGDTLPLPVIARQLPGGIDSRCYRLLAPNPSPTLSFAAAGVASVTAGQPAFTWPDKSLRQNTPYQSNPALSPVAGAGAGSIQGLVWVQGSVLRLPAPITLTGDFTASIVARVPSAGLGGGAVWFLTGANGPVFGVGVGYVNLTTVLGVNNIATGLQTDAQHIWVINRSGSVLTVSVDGTPLATFDDGTVIPIVVSDLVGFSPGSGASATATVLDLQGYDGDLDRFGQTGLLQTLQQTYPTGALVVVSCGHCTSMPRTWGLLTAGYPGALKQLNGLFLLTYSGGCTWRAPSSDPPWELFLNQDGYWVVSCIIDPQTETFYKVYVDQFSCNAPQNIPYYGGTNDGHPQSFCVLNPL